MCRIDDSVGQTMDASDPFWVSLHKIDAHKGNEIESKAVGQQTRDGSRSIGGRTTVVVDFGYRQE